jgi:Transglutaminase-like superfamily
MTLGLVPSGDAGVAATLKTMKKLARDGRQDALIIQQANALVKDLPQYDTLGEIKALHAFVRDAIRYTNDPDNVELLRTPRAILQMGVGDCDDKSTLLAALLLAIGLRPRFVAVAMGANRAFSHVLVEVQYGKTDPTNKRKGWLSLETIKPVSVGWSPPNVTRRMVIHV